MSREHRDEHFSEFRGHTLLKPGVLNRYAKAWIQILRRRHETLWILDGFAGKGKDDLVNPGLPLLLARSAAQLRSSGAEVRWIAIEERREHYDALVENLAGSARSRRSSMICTRPTPANTMWCRMNAPRGRACRLSPRTRDWRQACFGPEVALFVTSFDRRPVIVRLADGGGCSRPAGPGVRKEALQMDGGCAHHRCHTSSTPDATGVRGLSREERTV